MELIYILNVMIIINGKFNFTHTPKARGNRPHTGRVLNVIVKKKKVSGDKFLEVYNKESKEKGKTKNKWCELNSLSVCM